VCDKYLGANREKKHTRGLMYYPPSLIPLLLDKSGQNHSLGHSRRKVLDSSMVCGYSLIESPVVPLGQNNINKNDNYTAIKRTRFTPRIFDRLYQIDESLQQHHDSIKNDMKVIYHCFSCNKDFANIETA
jgi:hypothetical protein